MNQNQEWNEKSANKIVTEAVNKLRKLGKTKTLFRIPGEGKLGEWRTILSPFTPEVEKHLRSKFPNVIIANEDFEAAASDWTLMVDNRK